MKKIRLLKVVDIPAGVSLYEDVETGEVFPISYQGWREVSAMKYPNDVPVYVGRISMRDGVVEMDKHAYDYLRWFANVFLKEWF